MKIVKTIEISTAQQIVRSFGERTSRQRLKSDSTNMKQKYPRCNAIITGEQSPNIGESGTARQIISEIKAGDINWSVMTKAQENARNSVYSKVMRGYIEWVQNKFLNKNEELFAFVEILRSNFEKFRKKITEKLTFSHHPRIPSTLAHLYIGYKYFLEFCKYCFVLDEYTAINKEEKFKNILIKLAKNHGELLGDDTPTAKFISALKSLISSETLRIQEIDGFTDEQQKNKTLTGYYDNEFYYFIPKTTYNQVRRFYNSQVEHFPTSQNALLKQLAEEGFIKSQKGRNTLVKQINHKVRERFIYFHKDKFDKFDCIDENEVTEVTDTKNAEELPY